MTGLWQDVTYAVRSLGRQRGFAVVALAALGITIGLNSSLFTVYSAVAFRPWRVPDAEQVVKIFRVPDGRANGFSIAQYRHLSQHARSFEGIAAMSWYESDQLAGGRVKAQYVSGNYFRVLGVRLHRGRGFSEDEDDAERPQAVAVLTHAAWQRFFQGDPDVLGRSVQLRDAAFTIVGIAEEGFTGT